MRIVKINANDAMQRLDKFLIKYLPAMPKGALYKGLRKDCVRVNGKHVRDGGYMLNEGDELKLFFREEYYGKETDIKEVRIDFGIVYEDQNIILINKPRGTVVHADDKNTSDTLVEQLIYYLYKKGEYDPKSEHGFKPALCNRLDRNTSGIVIGAKNAAALRIINEKIRKREIHKLYKCRVEGIMKNPLQCNGYIIKGDKRVKTADKLSDGAKYAQLSARPIAYEGNTTIAEVELMTGRTHQIRAQLAAMGYPLVNDKKYSGHGNGKYELVSYKLRFDFKSDAGIMNYINGREFVLKEALL